MRYLMFVIVFWVWGLGLCRGGFVLGADVCAGVCVCVRVWRERETKTERPMMMMMMMMRGEERGKVT